MVTQADMSERDGRFRRLRDAMAEADLEALIVAGKGHWWTGRGYFRYLTDFHLWGHDGLILVPLEGEPMLTLTSAAVARRIGKRGWITDVHGDPDIAVKVVDAMKQRNMTQGRVGIAGHRFIISAGTYELLNESLPTVDFVNADRVMDRVRAPKSSLEIEQNFELWDLAKEAMSAFVEALEPGRSQLEVLSEPVQVVAAGGGRDTLIFFNGEVPSDKPVELEDILGYHMEICGPSGHWCELTLTLAFREPTDREVRLMESELRAYEKIREMAKPGVRIQQLAEVFEEVLLQDGWQLAADQPAHYDFHGQGMDVIEWPYYGPLDIREGDAELQEGMVFSYHPRRKVIPEVRSTGFNEDILITNDGAVRLSGDWGLRWRPME